MNLNYSTIWPKTMPDHLAEKPTGFVDQIWSCMKYNEFFDLKFDYTDWAAHFDSYNFDVLKKNFSEDPAFEVLDGRQKLHTIREDKDDRWKAGNDIHFFINARTKNMFRFAPVIPCISTQKIVIKRIDEIRKYYSWVVTTDFSGENYRIPYEVTIDGNFLNKSEVEILAKNDGFDNPNDFFSWFNKDFSGKIIHWTDLKY